MLIVTPYVGVWIETGGKPYNKVGKSVTPYVGVWIETTINNELPSIEEMSLLMWECGLKQGI